MHFEQLESKVILKANLIDSVLLTVVLSFYNEPFFPPTTILYPFKHCSRLNTVF